MFPVSKYFHTVTQNHATLKPLDALNTSDWVSMIDLLSKEIKIKLLLDKLNNFFNLLILIYMNEKDQPQADG